MLGVLSGFAVVWTVIAVGYVVGRTGVLGPHARHVLNRLTFFVASPALLFTTISNSDPGAVLGPMLWVATLSAFAIAGLYMVIARFWLRRDRPEQLVGAMSAGMVNSANLGMPIAVYVLGDIAQAAPIILFQLAIFTPVFLALLDGTTSRYRTTFWSFLFQTARNPMIVGSMVGLAFAVFGWTLPQQVSDPIELIGGASIPAMLLAFGISLVGSRPLQKSSGRRADVLTASALKLLVHPLAAWALGAFVFRLQGPDLFAVVVMAALPTAQNVFVTASRYERGVVVAKDTVLVTTVVAIPAMILVAAILT
ncbi:AEC family transporter [Arthrobacter ginkgonis]|uniref:AEC family transporter n=1 Tax=Arthrobacter ginkgonis TaxID=1630594 RepID=A0ABP7C0V9_9MICC